MRRLEVRPERDLLCPPGALRQAEEIRLPAVVQQVVDDVAEEPQLPARRRLPLQQLPPPARQPLLQPLLDAGQVGIGRQPLVRVPDGAVGPETSAQRPALRLCQNARPKLRRT